MDNGIYSVSYRAYYGVGFQKARGQKQGARKETALLALTFLNEKRFEGSHMGVLDYIIIFAAVFWTVRVIAGEMKNRKKGKCSGCCDGCSCCGKCADKK